MSMRAMSIYLEMMTKKRDVSATIVPSGQNLALIRMMILRSLTVLPAILESKHERKAPNRSWYYLKKNKRWIWKTLCRDTRELIAWGVWGSG